MKRFTKAGKTVSVYGGAATAGPVVYLNTYGEEGDRVYRAVEAAGCPDLTLVVISGLAWDRDMAPWEAPPISKNDTPCTGGADEYLRLLTEEIMPEAEKDAAVTWRGLAGYSLAGLFAVYALFRTDLFSRVASVSGSLWYPNLTDYVFSHAMRRAPDRSYFSLGDGESRTKNPYLSRVRENTEAIAGFLEKAGAETVFRLVPGGHFDNAVERTAAGVSWLIKP